MPTPECDLCKYSGLVVINIRSNTYRCAGPAPENARGCTEQYCNCHEGMEARRLEKRWSQS